jgi:hypothetical protein
MKPAIVISAYNRPRALGRLLGSLQKSAYPAEGGVPLIVSIDRGDSGIHPEVQKVAEQFVWPFGPKEVLGHERHLGLVEHVLFCGGLSETYGDVIFLEDDLLVSPVFYEYATQALDFYRADDRVAGLCLYALWFNGYTQQPFVPLADGGDTFFAQVPYTQGQAFTVEQWRNFKAWRASGERRLAPTDNLHEAFFHFDAEDWFPLLAKYAADTARFTVYPRVSLTTGAGDAGTHFARRSVFFQAPLQRFKTAYQFQALDGSVAVYDSFFEILPDRLNRLSEALRDVEYDVDLYATKAPRNLRAGHVLTTRLCRNAIRSFGQTMWPLEANVIEGEPGAEISLCRKDDLRWDWLAELETRKRNHDYFTRRRRVSRKLRLQFAVLDWLHLVRRWLGRNS